MKRTSLSDYDTEGAADDKDIYIGPADGKVWYVVGIGASTDDPGGRTLTIYYEAIKGTPDSKHPLWEIAAAFTAAAPVTYGSSVIGVLYTLGYLRLEYPQGLGFVMDAITAGDKLTPKLLYVEVDA